MVTIVDAEVCFGSKRTFPEVPYRSLTQMKRAERTMVSDASPAKPSASSSRLDGSETLAVPVTTGAGVRSLANVLNCGFAESIFTVNKELAPLGSSVLTTLPSARSASSRRLDSPPG
jgi:hypothetical protein